MGAFTPGVGAPAAMTVEERFTAALAALAAALGEIGRPWMLIGGLAVIVRGYPRHTDDIDATMWAPGIPALDALNALARYDITPRTSDALVFAEQAQMLLVQHKPSGMDLDISLAWLPFEDDALAHSTPVAIGDTRIPTASVEDLIIYKFAAWRERDRTDIEQLLIRHSGALDLARVRRYVQEFGTLLEDPDRVREFEALVRRVIT